MSVLANIKEVKVPYASEGIIRTAQIDDTVAPQDSVQLAVNMNFDRVGAIQTRPGVTSYADDLVGAVNSYGTLRNSIVPPGYEFISQLGSTATVSSSQFAEVSAVKVSDTKVTIFWRGPSNDGFCQNLRIDLVTGVTTLLGSPVEFDIVSGEKNKAIRVSDTRVLNVWQGSASSGWAQAFDVSGDTIVPLSSAYNFDGASSSNFGLAQIDSTRFLCTYSGSTGDGIATVLAVDAGSGAVTEPGSPFTFDAGSVLANTLVAVGNGTHFMDFWSNGSNALAQCFFVNTTTWAVTAIGSSVSFNTPSVFLNASIAGVGANFVVIYQGAGLLAAQAFALNLSTYVVTLVGTPLAGTSVGNDLTAVGYGDGYNFVAFYSKNVGDGYVQMINMNASTFNMTVRGAPLSGYDFANYRMTSVNLSINKVMAVWGNVDQLKGQSAIFASFGSAVNGSWLYAGNGTSVFNTPSPGNTWTSRRSGLVVGSKPRYAQYLNYIWMVNGNEFVGGDAVATSSGGAFGTDLIPLNFPKGDFISAGFEGRVWVANKTLGTINYTDIVQFIPPATYNLTYNKDVNFISTISPQTGQTITGLFEVPRALLVFTEDTITRVYGATSLDAYPAYNVGTYSQESIVETKTGIFFHHSSGFYQFDYGSQPVEISRRVIDFVTAIPRSYYDDITGVYDGFDCVEWSVGQVVVEGVVFSNCVLRYTISTQVWTVYDYVGNTITAMISYDDGVEISHLMGTSAGRTGQMDVGTTDFGAPFYYEFIDRWRAFTEMYYLTKSLSEVSVYSENAAGANLMYQVQKSGPNAWEPVGTVTEANNSILTNKSEKDFDVLRFRLAGNTRGAQVVVHGIEITQMTIKGQDEN